MTVVADTTILIILSQMNRLWILEALFGAIVIPPEVWQEYGMNSEHVGHVDLCELPWLTIQSPQVRHEYDRLDEGEHAAIDLARELKAEYLLIDEKIGRRIAESLNLNILGTVGVLERAAIARLVILEDEFRRLKATSFYVSDQFLESRLDEFRKQQPESRQTGQDRP